MRNYQLMLEEIINENQAKGVRPKLLLQACCAPCSSYPIEYLSQYFDITLYFYNPNTATSKWIWTTKKVTQIGKHVFAV